MVVKIHIISSRSFMNVIVELKSNPILRKYVTCVSCIVSLFTLAYAILISFAFEPIPLLATEVLISRCKGQSNEHGIHRHSKL